MAGHPDCQFHCLVVADFLGRLGEEVSGWEPIYNGLGRQRRLGGDFSGVTIEAIEWDYMLNSARTQNRALLSAAGMQKSGRTEFSARPSPDSAALSSEGGSVVVAE